jgi:DNA-directed RNA polymerase specialized sigma24 family protein
VFVRIYNAASRKAKARFSTRIFGIAHNPAERAGARTPPRAAGGSGAVLDRPGCGRAARASARAAVRTALAKLPERQRAAQRRAAAG